MPGDAYVAHFFDMGSSEVAILDRRRPVSAFALSILNNPAVIAVNQDPEGGSADSQAQSQRSQRERYRQGET